MKTLNAKKYRYVGIKDNWHVFESVWNDFDPEVLLVVRARYLLPDGTSIYFDPVNTNIRGLTPEGMLRLSAYENSVNQDCMRSFA
jgi:hypothetical protein